MADSSKRKEKAAPRLVLYGSAGLAVDPMPFAMPDGGWRYLLNGDFSQTSERTPAGLSSGGMRVRGGIAPLRNSALGSGPIRSMGAVPLSSPFGGIVPPIAAGTLFAQWNFGGVPASYARSTTDYSVWADVAALTGGGFVGGEFMEFTGAGGSLYAAEPTLGLQVFDGSSVTTLANAATMFPAQAASNIATVDAITVANGIVYICTTYLDSRVYVYTYTLATSTAALFDEVGNGWTSPNITAMIVSGASIYVALDADVAFGAFVYRSPTSGGNFTLSFTARTVVAKPKIGGLAGFNGDVWAWSSASDRANDIDAAAVDSDSWALRQTFALSGADATALLATSAALFAVQQRPVDDASVWISTGGLFSEDKDLLADFNFETIDTAMVHGDVLVLAGSDVGAVSNLFISRSVAGAYTSWPSTGVPAAPSPILRMAASGAA
jgi:hypothetical protein